MSYQEAIDILVQLSYYKVDSGPRGKQYRDAIDKAIEALAFCVRAGVIFRDLKP